MYVLSHRKSGGEEYFAGCFGGEMDGKKTIQQKILM